MFLLFRVLTDILESLQSRYTDTRLCRGPGYPCYHAEPDLVQLMRTSRDPAELLWAWHEWRRLVGPPSLQLYPALISIQNQGARNNGECCSAAPEGDVFCACASAQRALVTSRSEHLLSDRFASVSYCSAPSGVAELCSLLSDRR